MTGEAPNTSEDRKGWRSVRDSLPPYDKRVLLQCRWGEGVTLDVHIGARTHTDAHGEHWTFDNERTPREAWNVIAWMPLP